MSVRMIRWSELAAVARLGMVSVVLLGGAILVTPDALADTGGGDDTADSGGNRGLEIPALGPDAW